MKSLELTEDLFHCLPDELLLDILCRLVDLKFLCQCALVSKRFAHLITQTRSVSVSIIPTTTEDVSESYDDMFKLLCLLRYADRVEDIPECIESSIQKLKLPKFLEKFRDLETLFIEYGEPSSKRSPSFPKWKFKCNSSLMMESLVYLLPSSICKETDEQIEIDSSPGGMFLPIVRSTEWLCVVCVLVKTHTTLKRVTIVDAKDRCKLILQDGQLAEMRSCPGEELVDYFIRYFHEVENGIPIVKLPLSGFIMRDVSFGVFDVAGEFGSSGHKVEYDKMISWGFDNDEKTLSESIKEILENQRHNFESYQRY